MTGRSMAGQRDMTDENECFGPCMTCSEPTQSRAIVLTRSIESFGPASPAEQSHFGCDWAAVVHKAESVASFCSLKCWRVRAREVLAAWCVRFPNELAPPLCVCALCGRRFDGRHAHLVLTLSEEEALAGGLCIDTKWANELAAFCGSCWEVTAAQGELTRNRELASPSTTTLRYGAAAAGTRERPRALTAERTKA